MNPLFLRPVQLPSEVQDRTGGESKVEDSEREIVRRDLYEQGNDKGLVCLSKEGVLET